MKTFEVRVYLRAESIEDAEDTARRLFEQEGVSAIDSVTTI